MKIKQEDTFDVTGFVSGEADGVGIDDFTGYVAKSQIRHKDGTLIAELTCEWIDATARLLRMYFDGSTIGWQVGLHEIDIQFTTPDGKIVSTETAKITVEKDITRAV